MRGEQTIEQQTRKRITFFAWIRTFLPLSLSCFLIIMSTLFMNRPGREEAVSVTFASCHDPVRDERKETQMGHKIEPEARNSFSCSEVFFPLSPPLYHFSLENQTQSGSTSRTNHDTNKVKDSRTETRRIFDS